MYYFIWKYIFLGDHCANDADGCFGDIHGPCGLYRNCTDLPAQNHSATGIGYLCGPCQSGYDIYSDGTKCIGKDLNTKAGFTIFVNHDKCIDLVLNVYTMGKLHHCQLHWNFVNLVLFKVL